MKNSFAAQFGLLLIFMNFWLPSFSQIKIGVFADCQYCDCETAGTRFYRNSLQKLDDCINIFNKNEELSFVVGLGDLIDRGFSNFDSVNLILAKSKNEVYHVIGNHDLSVEKEQFENVPGKLNLNETWYSVTEKGWRFIFLNGNDITFHSTNKETVKRAEEISAKLKEEGKPNYYDWNGGIGSKQMNWFEEELQNASSKKQKVAVFCHYPLLPFDAHTLWNSDEVLSILQKFNCVKIYLNGHNHAGNYAFQNGVHFVNLKGMVETENENAFSVITFSNEKIEIKGFGREVSRSLIFE
ncbi:MAG TPA: metallophosphoesterase [Draconibacterium sp.]|nr:metallophosphoesterase [Draconibacterium sp.]